MQVTCVHTAVRIHSAARCLHVSALARQRAFAQIERLMRVYALQLSDLSERHDMRARRVREDAPLSPRALPVLLRVAAAVCRGLRVVLRSVARVICLCVCVLVCARSGQQSESV